MEKLVVLVFKEQDGDGKVRLFHSDSSHTPKNALEKARFIMDGVDNDYVWMEEANHHAHVPDNTETAPD